jgi:hypothetical protein
MMKNSSSRAERFPKTEFAISRTGSQRQVVPETCSLVRRVHAGAREEVDYGGGANSERQNLDWFLVVCGGSRARVYIGATKENPRNMGHAHVARPSRL